ncbi:hypothetical protein [Phytohabitans suffuscus]|uniref:Uncharacterized protein n=1 Tax=Phytohabitans suffuscus TaxID=624315 RepID=A0A6F8YBK7_9ACTN|nr:hypothetical protein [Phytohabitans suffuscus]BCB83514.1 hypothetical protein Psuf_008270 [Phytohabitans suffuscus]
MAQTAGLTTDQHKRLREIGDLLATARDLHLATFNITPRDGSQAAKDFTTDLFCEVTKPGEIAKPWPREALQSPRGLAVNLTHQAAIHLDALGLLYQTDRFEDVPGTVARAAFEYISRAIWVLDPNVTHRVRCARQQLVDLASFDELWKARKVSIPASDLENERKKKDLNRAAAIAVLTERFATSIDPKNGKLVTPRDAKGRVTLAGETYLGFTDLAEHFGNAVGSSVNGRELYDALAVLAHPQGNTAFNGLLTDQGDGTAVRTINYVQLERLAGIVAPGFHEALGCPRP